jgi:hypothetical protein
VAYTIILRGDKQRKHARAMLEEAQIDSVVTLKEPTRNLEQNAKFHAICGDLAKSDMEWAGKRRSTAEWKVLLVSGHTKATQGEVEIVPGLEGEFVNIRESTARMGVKRTSSLI